MKKYKLIKEYPGSDAKGTIAVLLETKHIYKGFRFNYDVRHVENSPEYWEEVVEVEKDYQILKSCPIEGTIYSVKRLSDGEVFTVGDTLGGICGRTQKIEKFYLNKEKEMCVYTDITCQFSLGYLKAKVVEKDYEIISFTQDSGITDLWVEFENGWCRSYNGKPITNPYTTEEILSNKLYRIASVKRLSDGEVFTVGDKFTGYSSKGDTIQRFELLDNILIIHTTNKGSISNTPGTGLFKSIQKEVEKDYEILSYIKKGSTTCTTTKRRGGIYHEQYWSIHSVKRLSDGEVFTVGDKIKVYQHGSIKTITEIELYDLGKSFKEGIWFTYNSGKSHMAHVIKQTRPIYLTHDGKDIFEGEQVWFVNKENLYFDYIMVSLQTNFCSEKRAYFLTRKEAEEYIRKNKVLFVADDGVNIFEEDIVYIVDSTNSIHTVKVLLSNKPTEGKRCYSTYEAAEKYAIEHSRALSIEDFWEITWMETSGFNKNTYMKNLVKKRLNLK